MTRYFAIVTSNHVFIAESGAVVPASQANASTRGVASRVRAFRSTTLGAEIVRRPRLLPTITGSPHVRQATVLGMETIVHLYWLAA